MVRLSKDDDVVCIKYGWKFWFLLEEAGVWGDLRCCVDGVEWAGRGGVVVGIRGMEVD